MLTIAAFLTRKLVSLGIPERWHRTIAWLAATLAIVALIALAVHLHTRRALTAHDAALVAAVATASAHADDVASAADAIRATDAANRAADNQGAIEDAATRHPVEVRAASGPAVNAIADRLRARQAKAGASAD